MPDVIIRDRMGRTISYSDIDTVALRTPEGAIAEFGNGSITYSFIDDDGNIIIYGENTILPGDSD